MAEKTKNLKSYHEGKRVNMYKVSVKQGPKFFSEKSESQSFL